MLEQKKTLRFLYENVQGKIWNIVLLCVIQMFLGISGVFMAVALRSSVDAAIDASVDNFRYAILGFSLLILMQIGGQSLVRYLDEYLKAEIENRLKKRMFSSLLGGEYASVVAMHSGEWMARLTSDAAIVADGLVTVLPGAAGVFVRLIGALATLLMLLPKAGPGLISCGGLLLIFTYVLRKPLKKLHMKVQDKDSKLRVFLQEHLTSLMIVKVYHAEEKVLAETEMKMAEHKAARMKRNYLSNLCNAGFHTMVRMIYLLGVIICGHGIMRGGVSYGTFVAVLQLIGQIQQPLAGITGYGTKMYAMLSSAERLMEAEILRQEESLSVKHSTWNEKLCEVDFDFIELENVTFTYPGKEKPTLSNVNMQIQRGECIAFVGGSGCGKSTFLKLLLALYPATEGEVNLISKNEKEPLTKEHRCLFAYVPQGCHLMSGTVREIVAFGNSEQKDNLESIEHVLQMACAEFVYNLPDGIDTLIGENGAGLSEGQLQRLSIARALFNERNILVLDEATSALDEETEWRLLCNLNEVKDKTVLIVTHRQAALKICDRVIDMEQFAHTEYEERQ